MNIYREGQSNFVDQLAISKRGNVKTAAVKTTEPNAQTVLKRFQKSKDIPKEYIVKHRQRLEKGEEPKKVITDFFKGLSKVKKTNKSLSLKTAMLFRQNGIFKLAEKNVYQDLETGDFWKISDDRGNVVRLFNEKDGVAVFETKTASKKKAGSYEDFLMHHGDEIKSAIKILRKLNEKNISDEQWKKIEKKMSQYDKNVDNQIQHWIGSHVEPQEIARFALQNMNNYGTEPQVVLQAIEDFGNIVGIW